MRILHVVPSYYPAVRYGGPIQSVHALARALAQRGHEVHAYTTNVDGPFDSEVPLNAPVDLEGVHVWYFPTSTGRRIYRSPQMGRALRANIPSFDIIHLHSVFLWPTSTAARLARQYGVPYLLAPRGMLVAELIRRKSSFAKRAWIALFERRNIAAAAAIHVTSELERAELARLGLSVRRVVVVPNGIDSPSTLATVADKPARWPGNQRYILFLGRLNWKKGLDRLIPALADVPGANLVIAGNDETDYRQELDALAMRCNVVDRVHFIGPVHGPEKWRLLAGAEIVVVPSYSENFGLVALEAMACARPVVVTPEVGLASAVSESGAGLVVEGDPAKIAAGINSLLQNAGERRRMGEAGRWLAQHRFSWSAIAEQMERVYRECLPKCAQQPPQASAVIQR